MFLLFCQEEAANIDEKVDEKAKHHSSSGKHKRKKHKHRSKHKKHKHASDEDKDRKRKHRHKHRKHKRKVCSSPSAAALFGSSSQQKVESSPSSGNPSLDDRAVLEDLEKQRAMIKAELDSQLMEGKVQSGMGLILQGYNSGSEEDGDARFRNGEQHPRGSSGKPISPRGVKSGKSRRDSTTEVNKSSVKRRSKSVEKPVKETKPDKGTKSSKVTGVKDRGRGRSRSKDRKRSDSTDQSKERRKSNSPFNLRAEQKVSRADRRSSPPRDVRPTQDRASRRSRSPVRERASRSDADRDKRPTKSPSKDTLGKENRSPHRRGPHSPVRRRSASPRHRDAHPTTVSASDRTSKLSHSPSRTKSSPRRARSRSADTRRRDADRQESPLRLVRSWTSRPVAYCSAFLSLLCCLNSLVLLSCF